MNDSSHRAAEPLLDHVGARREQLSWMQRWFYAQGRIVASYPRAVLLVSLVIVVWGCVGLMYVDIESNPNTIWVPPSSDTQLQEAYFNAQFDPFYRIEQIIFTTADQTTNMLTKEYLLRVLDVQEEIVSGIASNKATLDDFCFKPIKGKGCMIESPLNWWRSDRSLLINQTLAEIQLTTACVRMWEDHIPCTSAIGVPVIPSVILGGSSCNLTAFNPDPCKSCVPQASALMLTFLLNDLPSQRDAARTWETEVFLKIAANAAAKYAHDPVAPMQISYMAQRSVQDEIDMEGSENAFVVIVSYIAMFCYVAVALGKFPHPIRSRVGLGLMGIIIVAASVLTAIGACSYFGLQITLIVTEVVPFLILAIGVDNMFIIAKAYDREVPFDDQTPVSEVIALALSDVGPSITAAASSEFLAFIVGATTRIPALTSFCLVAAVAVAVDYVFQVTCFVALLSLDGRRQRASRMDCFCCRRIPDAARNDTPFWKTVARGEFVRQFIDKHYTPIVLNPFCKVAVILVWGGMLGLSCYAAVQMRLGLQQQLVLPEGSYMQSYFDNQASLGEAGPPMYVVLQNVNYTDPAAPNKVAALAELLAALPYTEPPVSNWLSSFVQWYGSRDLINNQLCPSTGCDCPQILAPEKSTFPERVAQYLNVSIDSSCCQSAGFCGAQFAEDVILGKDLHGNLQIMSSRLRAQHTALRNQSDFIQSMRWTQAAVSMLAPTLPTQAPLDVADPIPVAPGGAAFPYSLFYVYYEQYSYIQGIALQNVIAAVSAVFLATLIVADLRTAFLTCVCVTCLAIDMVGFLWLWNEATPGSYGVEINAVSVVNLVMAVGLAVEFCVHVSSSFSTSSGTRHARVRNAMAEMGSSVITGITLTKFVGVLVLAWAPSRLFRLYYFRMYFGIIVLGAFHGLMFTPVVLSLLPEAVCCERERPRRARESMSALEKAESSGSDE